MSAQPQYQSNLMSDEKQKDTTRKVSADALDEIRRTASKIRSVEPRTERASAHELRSLTGGLHEVTAPAGLDELTAPGEDEHANAQLQEHMIKVLNDFDPAAPIRQERDPSTVELDVDDPNDSPELGASSQSEPILLEKPVHRDEPILLNEPIVREAAEPAGAIEAERKETRVEREMAYDEAADMLNDLVDEAMAGSLASETEPETEQSTADERASFLPLALVALVVATLSAFAVVVIVGG